MTTYYCWNYDNIMIFFLISWKRRRNLSHCMAVSMLLLISILYFCIPLSWISCLLPLPQFCTPLTAEAPGGALRTPARACLTPARLRRWRSANYEVERGNGGTPGKIRERVFLKYIYIYIYIHYRSKVWDHLEMSLFFKEKPCFFQW